MPFTTQRLQYHATKRNSVRLNQCQIVACYTQSRQSVRRYIGLLDTIQRVLRVVPRQGTSVWMLAQASYAPEFRCLPCLLHCVVKRMLWRHVLLLWCQIEVCMRIKWERFTCVKLGRIFISFTYIGCDCYINV